LHPQIAYPFYMRYFLGFDGGGTKTECVLMNSADQVLARTFAGPSNPSRIGVELAVRALEESADLALRDAGLERSVISAVGAGLAGTAKVDMRERMGCALQLCFSGAAITVLTDLDAALAAAGEGPAIVLVGGTGSAAFGRNADGEIARSGGYGRSSSDQGSAYDIGRRAIAAAMRERVDESDSALGREILAQLGCAEWAVVQHRAQTMPDEIFPPIFPVVAVAADSGDAAAQEILLRASQDLAALVADVAGRLHLSDEEFLLVRMGGTMGRSRFFDAHIDAALKKAVPNAQIGKLRVSPAEAAALIAKESNAC
jgi:N-acetylglucosamine kinase-like BadF-type ATPase